jgi:hypothetical protein
MHAGPLFVGFPTQASNKKALLLDRIFNCQLCARSIDDHQTAVTLAGICLHNAKVGHGFEQEEGKVGRARNPQTTKIKASKKFINK